MYFLDAYKVDFIKCMPIKNKMNTLSPTPFFKIFMYCKQYLSEDNLKKGKKIRSQIIKHINFKKV